jgi:hypothetical protein
MCPAQEVDSQQSWIRVLYQRNPVTASILAAAHD